MHGSATRARKDTVGVGRELATQSLSNIRIVDPVVHRTPSRGEPGLARMGTRPETHTLYEQNFFAQRNKVFAHVSQSLPTFSIFAHTPQSLNRSPQSLNRPPQSLPCSLRSHGLGLQRTLAVEARRFKWKEIDVSIKIAVSLSCHCKRNRSQIIAEAGSHGLAVALTDWRTLSSW